MPSFCQFLVDSHSCDCASWPRILRVAIHILILP